MIAPWRLICADVLDGLSQLEDASVHTCITSPPYFGLRDYGTGAWEGGSADCDHGAGKAREPDDRRASTLGGGVATIAAADAGANARQTCAACGATRVDQQIGLEPTPDEFVAALVAVFREVRRVLRDDGTVWLNLGDSYVGSWGAQSRGVEGGSEAAGSRGNDPTAREASVAPVPSNQGETDE